MELSGSLISTKKYAILDSVFSHRNVRIQDRVMFCNDGGVIHGNTIP